MAVTIFSATRPFDPYTPLLGATDEDRPIKGHSASFPRVRDEIIGRWR